MTHHKVDGIIGLNDIVYKILPVHTHSALIEVDKVYIIDIKEALEDVSAVGCGVYKLNRAALHKGIGMDIKGEYGTLRPKALSNSFAALHKSPVTYMNAVEKTEGHYFGAGVFHYFTS